MPLISANALAETTVFKQVGLLSQCCCFGLVFYHKLSDMCAVVYSCNGDMVAGRANCFVKWNYLFEFEFITSTVTVIYQYEVIL